MTLRRSVAVAAAGLALLAACATEADDPLVADDTTTSTETTAGGVEMASIEWDDCGAVDCATVDVPLDYSDPDGEQIELYVARAAATGDRKGALFVNPGGPGAGAAELAEILPFILPPEIAEQFDIIGIDPRGVGGSTPIDCGIDAAELYAVDPTIETPEDEAALLEVSQEYSDDCGEEYADLLPHLGTRDVARDMDAIRAAIGDEQLSYLGFSYGTAIGQVYADLFPTGCARWCSTACSSSARPASSSPMTRPPGSRPPSTGSSSTATRPRAVAWPASPSRRSRRCWRWPRRRAGSRPPTPIGRGSRRGEPRHRLRAVLAELLGAPRRRAGRGARRRRQRDRLDGRRLHRRRRLRGLLRDQLHGLRVADGRPRCVLHGLQGDGRDGDPLR